MTIPDDTHIGRVALRVQDLDRMTWFYETVVGLHVLDDHKGQTVLGVDDSALLVLIADADAAPRQRSGAGLFHTAFRVPSRAALGDALARVAEHWELDGAADHLVSEAIYFTDPEDNGIEVYRDRPRDAWETTDDGMVKMATLRLDLDGVRQQAAGDAHVPGKTVIGHVHLEVTDLDAARRFYVDTLGMTVRQAMNGALFVAADDYHHHIGLNTWNNRTDPVSGRGLDWFELVLPDQAALAALRERCDEHGAAIDEAGSGFTVTGPDGIQLRCRTG